MKKFMIISLLISAGLYGFRGNEHSSNALPQHDNQDGIGVIFVEGRPVFVVRHLDDQNQINRINEMISRVRVEAGQQGQQEQNSSQDENSRS